MRPGTALRAAAALAAWLAAASAAGTGWAQARDPAAAEALFRAGLEALDRGDWDGACKKFEASLRLDPSAGTSINVARCMERSGRLANAWAELQRARVLAREAPDQRRREVEGYVDAEIRRIEPRLPRLRVLAAQLPADAVIRRDGIALDVGALGEPLPVDPGDHVVEASAPGHLPGRWTVTTPEGTTAEVVVHLDRDLGGLVAPPSSPGREPVARAGERTRTLPILGVSLAGLGVAGLAVGTVAGAHAIDAKGDIEELGCSHDAGACPSEQAREVAQSIADRGGTLAAVSTVSFVVGGLLVGTGAALLVVDATSRDGAPATGTPSRPRAARHLAAVAPVVGHEGGGVWMRGEF